jgi:ectoine hydroxylase-related dioxygenase (phytanoyl-CoA dioxygenase family)
MNTKITVEQIEAYRRDGFLILHDFLAPQELDEIREAIAKCVEQMGVRKVAGEGNEDLVESKTNPNRVFLQRINLWKISEAIKKYFLSPALGQMLCNLAGIDGIRVWHDQTLQKPPWANPTAWHTDNPKWSFHSPDSVSIWVALDDATVRNGCLYYLPGSHRVLGYDKSPSTGDYMSKLFEFYPDLKDIEAVPAEMKAGSAGVHNSLIAHAAGPNMTPHWRRAMTCAYMPDGATFNGIQNILSREQIEKLKVGDLLNDESQNPLIWSRKA